MSKAPVRRVRLGRQGEELATSLDAANVIANGQFDANVQIDGWQSFGGIGGGGAAWDGTDGTPDAGSLELTNPGACDCPVKATYCAAVLPDNPYVFSDYLKIADSSAPLEDSAGVEVDWFADSSCASTLSSGPFDTVSPSLAGSWTQRNIDSLLTPAAAHSAQVSLLLIDYGGFQDSAHFDDMEMVDDRILGPDSGEAASRRPTRGRCTMGLLFRRRLPAVAHRIGDL